MPRFAANLSMMFTEWDFLDRFAAARDAGFTAVEYLFPYEYPADVVADQLQRCGLEQVLFNFPAGNWAAGERGLAALPERWDEFQASIGRALLYACASGTKRLHLMAGIASRGGPPAVASYRRAVAHAAERLGAEGIELVIEPINARDMPGYFLNDFGFASTLIAEAGLPNLRLQFDLYHRQILHGDVLTARRALLPIIGHIQVAAVPTRHGPGTGEPANAFIFAELDRLHYGGFIGCEYRPARRTADGLGWFAPHRARRRQDRGRNATC